MQAAPRWLPLLLGFLQAVGPVSTDMYLPAFPAIEATFHAPPGAAQITLGTWILGLSFGQLIQGTLTDRFGRRGPLLLGTLIYTAATAGCALSPSIGWMAVWRFVAAFGGSASMIIPRAVVRDVAEGHVAAHMMSRLILILGVAPILAPSLGGLLLRFASWHVIFWVAAGYGAVCLVLAAWKLPDTLPPARRHKLHVGAMLTRYGQIVREPIFLTHTAIMSSAAFGLFAYLAGSPAVFITGFGVTPWQYAIIFGCVSGVYVALAQVAVPVIRRLGLFTTTTVATSVYLFMACVLLTLAVTHVGGVVALAVAMALTHGMLGFINPAATVSALSRHSGHAGSASAVMGTLQFLIGSSGAFLVAWLTNGTAVPMAVLIFAAGLCMRTAAFLRPASGGQGGFAPLHPPPGARAIG
jgi:DHA1 family bicyclomycin/chloramphenicol resistance-like MFS transporter